MSFLHLREAIGALDRPADSAGHLLSRVPWWIAYLLGATGVAALGSHMLIKPPDAYEIVFLTIVALFWIGLCGFWAGLARRSHERQSRMLDEYEHLIAYVYETNTLFKQSLDALLTWDRDKALELAEAFNANANKSAYDAYWRDEAERRASE